MSKHVFCRDLCLERGEPHEGTGNAPERMLLLAWPRGKWRTPRWESADMSARLAQAVHEAALAGVHVALVDKMGEIDGLPQLQAQPESVRADFASEADLIAAIGNYVDGNLFVGTPEPRTTILVCTDSRRDACCARYGFSTYKALTAIADPAMFNVVQATHLGGCRFAASLVVVPQRERYGRMTAGQVPAFIEALSRGEIFLPAYKGRTGMPEPLQVAELAALRWAETHAHGTSSITLSADPLPSEPADGQDLTVHALLHGTALSIRLKAKSFHVQGNCGVVAEGRGQHTLRWCLDRLTTAPTHQHSREVSK
jgi:(2Fe-2S) ferredoxin